jgi:hypothetical protein
MWISSAKRLIYYLIQVFFVGCILPVKLKYHVFPDIRACELISLFLCQETALESLSNRFSYTLYTGRTTSTTFNTFLLYLPLTISVPTACRHAHTHTHIHTHTHTNTHTHTHTHTHTRARALNLYRVLCYFNKFLSSCSVFVLWMIAYVEYVSYDLRWKQFCYS